MTGRTWISCGPLARSDTRRSCNLSQAVPSRIGTSRARERGPTPGFLWPRFGLENGRTRRRTGWRRPTLVGRPPDSDRNGTIPKSRREPPLPGALRDDRDVRPREGRVRCAYGCIRRREGRVGCAYGCIRQREGRVRCRLRRCPSTQGSRPLRLRMHPSTRGTRPSRLRRCPSTQGSRPLRLRMHPSTRGTRPLSLAGASVNARDASVVACGCIRQREGRVRCRLRRCPST
jgi:hypothetical protein